MPLAQETSYRPMPTGLPPTVVVPEPRCCASVNWQAMCNASSMTVLRLVAALVETRSLASRRLTLSTKSAMPLTSPCDI